jgi:MtrB/PioB family decaheme-associated outer membrane protein
MTTRILAVGLFAALLHASAAAGQDPTPIGQPPADDAQVGAPLDVNLRSVDFGVRINDTSGDEARFMRYTDYRSGPVVQGFRWTSENADRYWRTEADNVGYRDQRYAAEFEQFGKFKGFFEYNQIPYRQDYSTRTPYHEQSLTVLTVDDALQSGIQSAATTLTRSVDQFATPFALTAKRDITTFGGKYQGGRNLDVAFSFTSNGRSGHQPWGSNFGMNSTFETPAPIDHRNNEAVANVEWSNGKSMLRAGYDGSWFSSDVESLTYDNPLRISDSTSLSSAGRMARWASSTMHTISGTASTALPGRSRVVAYLARSAMTSDVDLLPWTVNTAIAQPPLPRPNLDADIDVTTVLLRFTSRPIKWAWFNANFRKYDLGNNTPLFQYDQKVNTDISVSSTPGQHAHQFSFDRMNLDLDGSFTPWRYGAVKIGYTKEDVDRTDRIYDTTKEDSIRLSYDWTNNPFVTTRASYVHSKRRGHGFHPEILEQFDEQPGMRHADISDRDRDVAQVIVTALPTSALSINFSGSVGNDDRPSVEFGLLSQDFSTVGIGFDYSPSNAVSLGLNYTYETFASLERSRTASPPPDPTFTDARRNWMDDIDENVDTVSAYVEVPKIGGKIDLGFNYDYTKADTSFFYSLTPDTTLAQPLQLPNSSNSWSQARLVANYWWRRNLSFGVTYLFDRFKVNDWGLGTQTLDRLAQSDTFLLMAYGWENYTAHTVWLKATYLW